MLNIAYEDGKISVVPIIRMLKPDPARKGFLPREQFDSLVDQLPDKLKPLVTFITVASDSARRSRFGGRRLTSPPP
jgi:hypothetical protein